MQLPACGATAPTARVNRARATRAVALGGAALAIALAAPRAVRADPLDGVTLRWDGPESCPDRGEVSAEARRLLPADGAYEPIAIDIAVREQPGGAGYRLLFRARSASRSADRDLALQSCDEAREAGGLLIALTLDPDAVAATETQPSETRTPEPPTPAPEPAAAAPAPSPQPAKPAARPARASARPASPRRREPGLDVGAQIAAGALADSAVLPELAFGAFAGAGVRVSGLRVALLGLYLPGAERDLGPAGGPSVRAALWAGQLGLCQLWRLGNRFELGPCASAELGRYSARSYRVAHTASDAALWAAGSAGVAAATEVFAGFSLFASAGALLPFSRPVLSLRDLRAAYIVPKVSLRAAIGVRWN